MLSSHGPCTDVLGVEEKELQEDQKVGQEPHQYSGPTWLSFPKGMVGRLATLTSEASTS